MLCRQRDVLCSIKNATVCPVMRTDQERYLNNDHSTHDKQAKRRPMQHEVRHDVTNHENSESEVLHTHYNQCEQNVTCCVQLCRNSARDNQRGERKMLHKSTAKASSKLFDVFVGVRFCGARDITKSVHGIWDTPFKTQRESPFLACEAE